MVKGDDKDSLPSLNRETRKPENQLTRYPSLAHRLFVCLELREISKGGSVKKYYK